ncbi:hypothetical protein FBUS_09129 [Fasciolopsis buskii]|uniref:Cyclin N-terminal domain-containing protein n=1 Tax=Fasciolopsis buskii TaxID=27845 RepID=A0A8E0VLU6_9TREM|nr:hypothetical protein FBUS_09129 [Fasciolopsis buski]
MASNDIGFERSRPNFPLCSATNTGNIRIANAIAAGDSHCNRLAYDIMEPEARKTTGRVQTLSAPPPSVTGLLSGQHQSQQKQSQQLQSQTQQQVRRLSQSQPHTQQSTSNSVLSNEPLLTAFVADPSRSLSSMRPVGDEASKCEVVSFAQFLKPQSNLWLSSPYACTLLQPNCLAYGFRDSEFAGSNPSDPLKAAFGPTSNRSCRRHLSNANLTGLSPWSRSAYAFPRARNSSGGSGCLVPSVLGSSPSGIVYPDPLVYYVPTLLDDPDLLIATGKRVLKLPNYLVSPTSRFQNVFVLIFGNNVDCVLFFGVVVVVVVVVVVFKSVYRRTGHELSLDLWIAAHGIVLFEKLILRLLVNKLNRRLCASAVLLISAKLNDVKRNELSSLVQSFSTYSLRLFSPPYSSPPSCTIVSTLKELENQFKISRRDLIQTELDVALSLEFCLVPGDQEIMIHYLRIHKSLDLTPSYSLSCLGRLPHSASLPSVTVHEHATA